MHAERILLGALAAALLLMTNGAMAADEPASPALPATVYQQTATGSCTSSTCTMKFKKVPGNKTLQTTNLSCLATATGLSGIPAYATLQVGKNIVSFMPLTPFVGGGSEGLAAGALAGATFIEGGKAPQVVITGAIQAATCTLSGRLD